jgi:hypothetical protein
MGRCCFFRFRGSVAEDVLSPERQRKPVSRTGFLEDVHQVHFDGTRSDVHRRGDVFVFEAAADEFDDLPLAYSDSGCRARSSHTLRAATLRRQSTSEDTGAVRRIIPVAPICSARKTSISPSSATHSTTGMERCAPVTPASSGKAERALGDCPSSRRSKWPDGRAESVVARFGALPARLRSGLSANTRARPSSTIGCSSQTKTLIRVRTSKFLYRSKPAPVVRPSGG